MFSPALMSDSIRAEACRRSFAEFIRQFWPVVEPGVPLVWGDHIQAIADHLQAVWEGRINRLMIAIPPGFGKSMFTSVMWQPWIWTQDPSVRQLYGSYDETLTFRDSMRSRDIVKSKKYQKLFKPDWYIRRDQDSKGYYLNSAHGSRKTYYIGSRKITGWRGDHVLIDDPLSAKSRYDKITKAEVIDSYDRVLSTRVNDPRKSAFVVIMQRLADDDLIGHILSKYPDKYEYLMLPMEFDPSRRCRTSVTSKRWPAGFEDWRTEEGELLFPEKYPREKVDELKAVLGKVDADAQLQHDPHPEGGSRFLSAHFQYWEWIGTHHIKVIHRSGREESHRVDLLPQFVVADLACGEKREASNDFTVIGRWALTPSNEIILLHRRKVQLPEPKVIKEIQDVYYNMPEFGRVNPMWAGLEANGLGLPIAQGCRSATPSVPTIEIFVHKDKLTMSAVAITRLEGGQVFFPSHDTYDWVHEFTGYLVRFPGADHDDDVTMVSLAANSMYEQTVPILGQTPTSGIQFNVNDPNRTRADLGKRKLFGG